MGRKPRKTIVRTDPDAFAFDDTGPDITARQIRQIRWPELIDDGYISPPEPEPRADGKFVKGDPRAGVGKKGRSGPLSEKLRGLLAKEVAGQLPKLRRELNRRNRLWYVEFCAKYGIGNMTAKIKPDGTAAETPPGKLSSTDIQAMVMMILSKRSTDGTSTLPNAEVTHVSTTPRLGEPRDPLGDGVGSGDEPI